MLLPQLYEKLESVNAYFKETNADIEESKRQFDLTHKSLKFMVYDFHGNCQPAQNIDFRSKLNLEAENTLHPVALQMMLRKL